MNQATLLAPTQIVDCTESESENTGESTGFARIANRKNSMMQKNLPLPLAEEQIIGRCKVLLCFAAEDAPGCDQSVLTLLVQSYADRVMNRPCAALKNL